MPDEVYYMEATGNSGVVCKKFSNLFSHINGFYEKIAFRKIKVERSNEMLEILDDFVVEANGQPYRFRLREARKGRMTSGFKKTEERQYISKDRSFYCSELVAKLFKTCGIIEDSE